MHLAPGASHVSAGVWVPEKEALHALRSAFAEDDARAKAFDRILAARSIAPYLPLETASMRITPRGFPKRHPRLPLIRARNYMLERPVNDAELRANGVFATIRNAIKTTAPFVRWLDATMSA